VNSIPKLHKQYDIKMIVILEDFAKLIAETLNSFFSKLVNNELRLYRTQPTIWYQYLINNVEYNSISRETFEDNAKSKSCRKAGIDPQTSTWAQKCCSLVEERKKKIESLESESTLKAFSHYKSFRKLTTHVLGVK
jgi:hypothetical protein